MRTPFFCLLLLTAAALLVPAAFAQPKCGTLGKILHLPTPVETLTKNNGCLGVDYGPGAAPGKPGKLFKNYLWVTARKLSGATHFLYQIDLNLNTTGVSTLAATYTQPAAVSGSSWGIRDLAYDSVNNFLWGGTETSVSSNLFSFNCLTLTWGPVIPLATTHTCIRAVAVDPQTKRIWVGNWSSPFEEFDYTGALKATYPAHGAKNVYGLAYISHPPRSRDRNTSPPCNGNHKWDRLWSFGDGGTSGSDIVLQRHDISNGCKSGNASNTGVMTVADTSITPSAGYPPGGIIGGLGFDFVKNPIRRPWQRTLFCLQQALADSVSFIDADWWNYPDLCNCITPLGLEPTPGMLNDLAYVGNGAWGLRISDAKPFSFALLMIGSKCSGTCVGFPPVVRSLLPPPPSCQDALQRPVGILVTWSPQSM